MGCKTSSLEYKVDEQEPVEKTRERQSSGGPSSKKGEKKSTGLSYRHTGNKPRHSDDGGGPSGKVNRPHPITIGANGASARSTPRKVAVHYEGEAPPGLPTLPYNRPVTPTAAASAKATPRMGSVTPPQVPTLMTPSAKKKKDKKKPPPPPPPLPREAAKPERASLTPPITPTGQSLIQSPTGDKVLRSTIDFTWSRGEELGRGANGRVFRGMIRGTGQLLAIKQMDVDMDNDKDSTLAKSLMAEVELLQGLDHPHIVKFYGVELRPHSVCIFLEMMPGGCLQTLLKQLGPLDERTSRHYTYQVISGLVYLHERNIVHRDLKCANVLLSLNGTVKVSDFGCSKRIDTLEASNGGENTILTHTITGSVPWMAPEVVGSAGHGRKADIWAVGCMVVEMLTAEPPWGKLDNIMAAVMRISTASGGPEVPEKDGADELVTDDCKDFVHQCTIRDPEARPNATDLYERHRWLVLARQSQASTRRGSS
ncbi:hypothetical protein FOL47_010680 [Perkinsus chesapeaki]|uniref:Protein kinase domain-containing protein n=1 Tax=Perkinsus chesapeaki TaxID=330153 RepID=A0A7J6MP07_PERCH|nr:hypothetical protein FOL47_010680 [Perkinsus chesapeaki]